MPALAPTTIGPVTMGPVTMGPATLGGGPTTTTSLVALAPASAFLAGPEVAHYWAARSGRAGSNYTGTYLLLDEHYAWWTLDGVGHDPGLDVVELTGLTGHVVALAGGNRTAAQVATATATVIDAIDGWTCSADDDTLEIEGPAAVTTGTAWDDATTGSMMGMRSISGTHEGPISNALAQYLPAPGLDLPLLAIDILIGATADNTDRWRGVLYAGVGGSASPVGEARTIDLGQLDAGQIVANRWARWDVPPSSNVRGSNALWFGVKGELGVTTVRGVLSGNTLRGDWPNANLLRSDQGEPSPIDPDATVAWPSTWPGAMAVESGFVMGVRLIYGGTVGDASHHSATDPAVWGVHVEPSDLGSTIDFNSNLATVGLSPPFLGMRLVDLGFAVGAARGTQPRTGVMTGGDMSSPSEPDIDGATLLVDGGRLTGSSTTAWENRSLADTPWPASTVTSWWTKNNDDSAGTNIAFAQSPDQANASPAATPMDFPTAEASPSALYGPEYEVFPADSAYNVTNPAVTFVSPFAADPDDQRPRNVPGARLRFRIPGITIAS
jgi:hypothetical protein